MHQTKRESTSVDTLINRKCVLKTRCPSKRLLVALYFNKCNLTNISLLALYPRQWSLSSKPATWCAQNIPLAKDWWTLWRCSWRLLGAWMRIWEKKWLPWSVPRRLCPPCQWRSLRSPTGLVTRRYLCRENWNKSVGNIQWRPKW